MKLNSTATFTFVLLFLMIGAGALSSVGGFSLGSQALKGVRQPDSRPNKASGSDTSKRTLGQADINLLKEEDILKAAKEKVNSSLKAGAKPEPAAQKDPLKDAPETKKNQKQFPFSGKNNKVTIEITAMRRQDEEVIFDMALKNDSNQPVKFLYSYLTIMDDQGKLLNGETKGLPAELGPESDRVTGTVRIPTSQLSNSSTVSFQLPDYPDQKIQLEVSDVPVK